MARIETDKMLGKAQKFLAQKGTRILLVIAVPGVAPIGARTVLAGTPNNIFAFLRPIG
jgi:hypothetical protein